MQTTNDGAASRKKIQPIFCCQKSRRFYFDQENPPTKNHQISMSHEYILLDYKDHQM